MIRRMIQFFRSILIHRFKLAITLFGQLLHCACKCILIIVTFDENKNRRVVDKAVDKNALYAGNRQSSNQCRNHPKQKKNYPCYIRGSLEHWASKCPQRPEGTAKNVIANFQNLYFEVATTEEVSNVTSTSRWCFNSGCTTHMCANEEMMDDLQECTATLKT